jgi:2-polyprenyl-6-methoxyphenol hydroxylase-like FAD-dependent oxidoreductase
MHRDRLVVVGGSIVGLIAARILSDHFAEVTIVEPADVPENSDPLRGLAENSGPLRGVPQSVYLHGLTPGGCLALDQIYGNDSFTTAMRDVGAAYLDFFKHQAVLLPVGWQRCAQSDVEVVCDSRSLLEHVIRTLTRMVPNISFRTGDVVGLRPSADFKGLTEVRVLAEGGADEVMHAELVVDATGRGSRASKWIEELGYRAPEESMVEPFVGSTKVYGQIPDDASGLATCAGFTRAPGLSSSAPSRSAMR